ncbi:Transcription factor SPT20-like [Quillaja saponaria]|uniref:Transcription factor SPT20-like n=1 Tax=Quillaja saponaria TaxID=32244 RepID=A0AAD7PE17_QUISA|nr:Transcription factor SPT20-like [Quillaja saponaria]
MRKEKPIWRPYLLVFVNQTKHGEAHLVLNDEKRKRLTCVFLLLPAKRVSYSFPQLKHKFLGVPIMGVSFKVSKTGTRYRPKTLPQSEASVNDLIENSKDSSQVASRKELSTQKPEGTLLEAGQNVGGVPNSSVSSERLLSSTENEVSFTLSFFPDGYFIGKSLENGTAHQPTHQDAQKLLHPYDRASESLLSAIESGRLPGDILDDIPCKYIDGTLTCEVRDYRRCPSEKGTAVPSDGSPIVNRISLRMSLENVVKDIPLISDNSWTYGDLMEVESRILKALQPQLYLDPNPKLDRLCDSPVPTKLNLAPCSLRRKRLRQMQEVAVTSSNRIHGKKVCIDRVPESTNCRFGDSGTISGLPMVSHQSRYQMGVGTPRSMQEHGSVSVFNASGASPAAHDMMISHSDNANSSASLHGKRDNQDGQMSPLSNFSKRARPASVGIEGMQQQHVGSQGLQGSDMNWQNALLQQQVISRGMHYANPSVQKFSQQAFEGGLNQDTGALQFATGQQGMSYVPKEEQFGTEKLNGSELKRSKSEMQMEMETSHLDPQSRLQQRLPQHAVVRSNFPQTPWNNLGQYMEKDARKEDQLQKRKSVQSPRLSAGAVAQSPLSSKSGEFSSGSVGLNFGTGATTPALGALQKEKTAITSVAAAGTPSLTSSANDSTLRQHNAQVAAKRRSNSLPKTPGMSGVGSPVSVSNMSVPLNANSPSVGTPHLADQSMLERFSKIEMVTMRHQLNCKKNKIDDHLVRKPNMYSYQRLSAHLSNASNNNEDLKDDACARSLSKSLVGGSINVCKIRVLNFLLPERVVQGNDISYIPKIRTRMIMSEKPFDGTVAMHYGEIEDGDYLAAEDYLPTLPNTHFADLLAAQFSSLMVREGYMLDERVQPKPNCVNLSSGGQSMTNNEMQQYAEPVSGQPSSEAAKPANSGNASLNTSQNLVTNQRMLPPGNQALQISQGLLSGVSMPTRPQQMDPQQSVQQQQQQQQQQQNQHTLIQQQNPQFQRSPMMLGANTLSHLNAIGQNSNMQLGNHMVNKPSHLQIQLLQQQQQQQQQQQLQRKMMMGIGTAVGMGNMGNNMVGLGGLGSSMGMGAARGMGGTGISAPVASMSGMGNMGQNPLNPNQSSNINNAISQQLRLGTRNPTLALMARMAQNRGNLVGMPQSTIGGMSGARQMHPGSASLSMLGQTLGRTNLNPLQRAAMGPPKLMAGLNLYMNQQQQLQQQQIQRQLQQQLQQQQETTSLLQAVVSPPQVGSPSATGVTQLNQQTHQQQQASPQQLSQRTPMSPQQMSSGAIHAMSAGNPEACPASPQLSSQTLGSVGSITNSPMDLQGVNKSNSVSNA